MQYDQAFFDAGIDRAGTNAFKWVAKDIMQEGTVPLWVADMDFACAEPIRQALVKRAEHACYGYTFPSREDALALIGFWKRRHKLDLKEEQLVMLPSVVTGLRAGIQTLTHPGDGVIIQSPVYGPFEASVRESGRVTLDAGLKPKTDALSLEGADSPYVNYLVARPDNRNDPRVQALATALRSQAVKDFIARKYDGAVIPAA